MAFHAMKRCCRQACFLVTELDLLKLIIECFYPISSNINKPINHPTLLFPWQLQVDSLVRERRLGIPWQHKTPPSDTAMYPDPHPSPLSRRWEPANVFGGSNRCGQAPEMQQISRMRIDFQPHAPALDLEGILLIRLIQQRPGTALRKIIECNHLAKC